MKETFKERKGVEYDPNILAYDVYKIDVDISETIKVNINGIKRELFKIEYLKLVEALKYVNRKLEDIKEFTYWYGSFQPYKIKKNDIQAIHPIPDVYRVFVQLKIKKGDIRFVVELCAEDFKKDYDVKKVTPIQIKSVVPDMYKAEYIKVTAELQKRNLTFNDIISYEYKEGILTPYRLDEKNRKEGLKGVCHIHIYAKKQN